MFSRSKRFLEEKPRAPSPGKYNPKYGENVVGPATFNRSPRSRPLKDQGPPVGFYDPKYPDTALKCSSSKIPSRNIAVSCNKSSRLGVSQAGGSMNSALSSPVVQQVTLEPTRRRSQSATNLCITSQINVSITCSEENLALIHSRAETEHLKRLVAAKDLVIHDYVQYACTWDTKIKEIEENHTREIDQCMAEANRLNELITQKNSAIRDYAQRIETMDLKLSEAKEKQAEKIDHCVAEANRLNELVTHKNSAIGDYVQRIETMDLKIAETEKKHSEKIDQFVAEANRLNELVTQKNSAIGDYVQRIETMDLKIAEIKKKHAEKIDQCVAEADQLKQLVTEKESTTQGYTQRVEILESKVKDNEEMWAQEKSQLCGKIAEFEVENSKYAERLTESENSRKISIDRAASFSEENRRLLKSNDDLKVQLLENQRQFLVLQTEVTQMYQQVNDFNRTEQKNLEMLLRKESEWEEKCENLSHFNENLKKERDECKKLYEELLEKIEPFKEQLDMYYSEQEMLSNHQNQTDQTLNEVLEKYAQLISHHNQKQKILHFIKLKDELVKVRQENHELCKKLAKSKTSIEAQREKINKLEGKRRFDPKLAFRFNRQHNGGFVGENENLVDEDKEN